MFYNEDPPNPSIKRCILKEIFSNFRTFGWKLSSASLDEEYPPSDSDNEEEVLTNQTSLSSIAGFLTLFLISFCLSFYPLLFYGSTRWLSQQFGVKPEKQR